MKHYILSRKLYVLIQNTSFVVRQEIFVQKTISTFSRYNQVNKVRTRFSDQLIFGVFFLNMWLSFNNVVIVKFSSP
ncbi:hypothetical protein DJ94_867 [Bacillus pseudomycoides]|nr:hypothetical protein DJ94_867 [Bacillus pseudomycoides]